MASRRDIQAGKAHVTIYADKTALVRGLRAAERRLNAFAASVGQMGRLASAASAAILAPLSLSARTFAQMGDEAAKMAARTGLSTEAVSELGFVAIQTGGDISGLENQIRRMQRTIYDAGRGLSTATDALADMGLSVADLAGLSPEDQFMAMANALSGIEDVSKRAALATVVFGRSGTALLPMLGNIQTVRGEMSRIQALRLQAQEFGLSISPADAAAAERLTDALSLLRRSARMVMFQAGAALGAEISAMAEKFSRAAKRVADFVRANRGLVRSAAQVGLVLGAVGVALLSAAAALKLAAFGFTAVKFAATLAVGVFNLLLVSLAAVKLAFLALASPIGLIGIVLASVGAGLIAHTGAGTRALDTMRGAFSAVGETGKASWGGIVDAIKAGNLRMAGKIALKGLHLAFLQFVSPVRELWHSFVTGLAKGIEWFSATWGIALDNLRDMFGNIGRQISRVFWLVVEGIAKAINWVAEKIAAALDRIPRLRKMADTFREIGALGVEGTAAMRMDAELEIDRAAAKKDERDSTRVQEAIDQSAALDQAAKDSRQERQAEIDRLRKELDGLVAEAAALPKPTGTKSGGGDGANVPTPTAVAAAIGPVGVAGAFELTAASLLGLASGAGTTRPEEETARNTAAIAENTERISHRIEETTRFA